MFRGCFIRTQLSFTSLSWSCLHSKKRKPRYEPTHKSGHHPATVLNARGSCRCSVLAAEKFEPIANEAALKELRLLSSRCIAFARDEPSAADALVEKGDQLRDPRLQIN